MIGARAAALGGVATIFGVMGHVHAGGSAPGLAGIAWVWLASSVLSIGFLIRRAGLMRIASLLLAEQVLVHVGLMWLVGMPNPGPMQSMPGMADMPGMMSMPAPHASPLPSLSMLAAHALAAAIAGLWLWRGECALWSLMGRVVVGLHLDRHEPITPATAPDLRIETGIFVCWGSRIAREVPRRGPPQVAMP